MVFDVLFDLSIELVILMGLVGCGKILFVFVSVFEMIIEKGIYDKVIVICNMLEIVELIGFLFGIEEEKMVFWLVVIIDILEVLYKGDENLILSCNYIMEKVNV